ncbi:MAG: YbaK/EbsC family protein [Eubacteriales bacterium]|nr:YbaK/EbsC family protein [Eubacteriales bacterium]
MAIERVKQYFAQYGMEGRIREFSVSSATVEQAARALSVEEKRIAKSLAFWVHEQPILIVMAGDARVDNAAYKARFHVKAKMMDYDEVEKTVGHGVGGVCPFGINPGIEVYLDESLKRFDTVFPACGSSNSAIGLTLGELERYSGAKGWVDVCRGWREEAPSGPEPARTA